jgi:hypothetical protein
MNKLISFLMVFMHACCPAGAATPVVGYPTSTAIRLLKQNLDLNGQVSILSGAVDPTVTATSAPLGSLYISTSTGSLYRKMDAGSTTNWAVLGPISNFLTNLLVDGSFESVSLNSAWVPQSGTMTGTVVTSDFVDGKRALSLSSSGASVSGNLLAQTISTLPNTDAMAIDLTASFKTTSANLQMCLGQAGVNLTCQAIPATGKWVTLSFTAPMPTANANFYVSTTSAGVVDFKIDNAYLGLSQNIGTVAQAAIVGTSTLAPTSGCIWSTASTTFAPIAAQASCGTPVVDGVISQPAGKTPTAPVVLSQGRYEIEVSNFAIYPSGASTDQACLVRITDGTNTYGYADLGRPANSGAITPLNYLKGFIDVTSSLSATLQLQMRSGTGNGCNLGNDNTAANNSPGMRWIIKRFPSQQEQVVRLNNQPVYAGKTWLNVGVNIASGVAASTTRYNVGGGSLYTTFGSAVNDSSSNIQVSTYMPIGEYEISVTGLMRAISPSGAANSGAGCNWDIYDSTAGATVGGALVTSPDSTVSTNTYNDLSVIKSYVKITTAGTKTYQLRVAKLSGANASYCQYYADQITSGSLYNASMMIRPLNQNVNVVIPGSVTSGSAGQERVERVSFGGTTIDSSSCTTSPCTIWRGSGAVSSVTRSGTGTYVINFTVPFTGPPQCTAIGANPTGATAAYFQRNTAPTASTFPLVGINPATQGAVDAYGDVICQGPR